MAKVDYEAIRQRDRFISDITSRLDESGMLLIDCPDFDTDAIFENMPTEIDAYDGFIA